MMENNDKDQVKPASDQNHYELTPCNRSSPKSKLPISNSNSADKGTNQSTKSSSITRNEKPTVANVLLDVTEKIRKLKSETNLSSLAVQSEIKFLWELSRYKMEAGLQTEVIGCIEKENFVEVLCNIWKQAQQEDIFDPSVQTLWRTLRNSLSLIWNSSDASTGVCEQVTKSELLEQMMKSLNVLSRSGDYFTHEKKLYYVKSLLGILHNCVRNYTECHPVLVQADGIHILQRYNKCPQLMVKAKSLIILSYIVNEEQNEIIHTSEDTIKFILDILHHSLASADHFSKQYGMNCIEVLKGLNNIALNDKNKVTLVECGLIPCLTGLLRSDDKTEKLLAAIGVWTLSFAKGNKATLKREVECIKALQDLRTSDDAAVGHSARSALWEIFYDQISPDADAEINAPHVMISYQWDVQDMMIKVKDKLTQAGYKVWMDVEHMSGSTLEAMALAVEKAAVVLICMSEKYKLSPGCRTESEYVYRLRKDIIPLRVQAHFVPDGWLGILVGTRLYFDISNPRDLESQVAKVIRELGRRGKILSMTGSDITNGLCGSSDTSSLSSGLSQSVSCWTSKEVSDWLSAIGLEKSKDRFLEMDGGMLVELKRIQKAAPEFFYASLKTEMKLTFLEILKFSRALSTL